MKENKNANKKIIVWLCILFVSAFVYASFTVDLPYYIEVPGGVQNVDSVLEVKKGGTADLPASEGSGQAEKDQPESKKTDKSSPSRDSYNFTYVSVGRANLASLIYAWLTPYTDIYSAAEMTRGASGEEFNRINQFHMETSQHLAEYQALTLAGEEVQMKYLGVYVMAVAENSTFKKVLNIADTVTGVNGRTFQSSKELMDYVYSLELDSDVSVTFTSDGKERTEKGAIVKLENGKNGIGIGLIDHTEVESSHEISYKTEGLGGPSAGLMFTLSIYTQLKEPDLRGGRMIAGTGTIESDGRVGDVGGVDKKVVSAAQGGADVFFVPDNPVSKEVLKVMPDAKSNYQEAVEAAKELDTEMTIVPVKTAQDAIDYLRKTKE